MLIDEALNYYGLGWSMIPVKGPKTDDPKAPVLTKWERFKNKQPTRTYLHGWFDNANEDKVGLAIVCGPISGIGVIDVDSEDTFKEICRKYEIDPCGPNIVKSGRESGGYHIYYHTGDMELPNKNILLPGVEFQGAGAIIVAPPTVHPSGRRYEWVNGKFPTSLPDAPTWLLQELSGNRDPYATEVIPDGERDNTLTSRVGHWFKSGMSYGEVLSMAKAVNRTYCRPPLSEADVIKIVNSIQKREKGRGLPAGEPAKFEVVPFSSFMVEYGSKEFTWTVEGWLPDATCGILSAVPGSFKTFALCDLALSVATGKKFLGRYDVAHTGPVLLIQQEDSFHSLARRFSQVLNVGNIGITDDDQVEIETVPTNVPLFMYLNRNIRFDDPAVIKAFSEQISSMRPKLVVMDPLYSMAEADDYMTKAAQQMMFMKKLRDETGTSFFIAHHMVKSREGKVTRVRDLAWGSQFVNAWLETGWEFMQDEEFIVAHRHFKDGEPPKPTFMKFDIGEGYMNVLFDDNPDIGIEDQVRSLIMTEDIASIQEVCTRLSINSKSTVQRALQKLRVSKRNGVYKI